MNGQQLKNSILQWAIRGKLVPQCPDDEPAAELLQRINPHFTPPQYDEPLPQGWTVATLSDICTAINGLWKGKKGPFVNVGVIRNANFTKDFKLDYSKIEYLDVEEKSFKKRNLLNGDLIVEKSGGGEKTPVGRTILYEGKDSIYSFSNFTMLLRIKNKEEIQPKYLYYFLLSLYLDGVMFEMQTNTTGLHNLLTEKFLNLPVLVPPLAEQGRIVERLEELLPLVERYGKAQEMLDKLNGEIAGKLRASVLQEAIRGKLVPQCPDDEPAAELLQRINPHTQPITEGTPFDIPKSWCWCKLGEIGKWQSGATPSRHNNDYYGGDISWLKTGDLNDGLIEVIPENITQKALEETSVKLNPAGSVVIAMYGATIGKVGILTFPATTNQACCACSDYKIEQKYLFYFLLANRANFIAKGYGGAQPNISKEKIIATLFPLPPLAEQGRIVERLEELLGLVCRLQ